MKPLKFFFAAVLLLGVFLTPVDAQPLVNIFNFTDGSNGIFPTSGLVLSGNTLYGTTSFEGLSGTNGTVFAVNTDGTDFRILYAFTGGADGSLPEAGLVLSGTTLYGAAAGGGISNNGTIFALSTGGTGFMTLYTFTNGRDGSEPVGDLVLSGNTLYGTASGGGNSDNGTVFAVSASGNGFKMLYAFTNDLDGSTPDAGLTLSGNMLYGTASEGGNSDDGTVFAVSTAGTNFQVLHAFTNGSDGSDPEAGVTLSGGTLYGTTFSGGFQQTNGTIFSITTNGKNFETLYAFTNGIDGSAPQAALIVASNTLYGTATAGGIPGTGFLGTIGAGTIFSINTNGTGFNTIYAFTGGGDGSDPAASLILSGSTLYGTAFFGGVSGVGSVFTVNSSGLPSFTTLYDDSDGSSLDAGFVLSGSSLYGTAEFGGNLEAGTILSLNTNGEGYHLLYSFTNGNDGSFPVGDLILSGNTLYGTAEEGGIDGWGSVFSLNTSGSGFKNVYSFTGGSDGASPEAGVILSGNTLYGTTQGGGFEAGLETNGTIFSVNITGSGFKTLYAFTNGSDGSQPEASLILSGNTLYGTASAGGTHKDGTVFSLTTNGTGFTTLYTFTNGSDGAYPLASLILSGGTLYGTASSGGFEHTNGTIFSVSTDGENFETLYTFTNGIDGSVPEAALILSGHRLIGTASAGGVADNGTIFSLSTNGGDFTTLYTFFGGSDGFDPMADLILAGNILYGGAADGGNSYNGTVFALNLGSLPLSPITLTIQSSGKNVILSWDDPSASYILQASTNLTGVFTNLSGATSPYSAAINASGQFYRLMALP